MFTFQETASGFGQAEFQVPGMSCFPGGLDNRYHEIQAYMKSQKIFMCIGSNSFEA